MTTFTAGDDAVDTTEFDLNSLTGALVQSGTATSVTMTYSWAPGYADTYTGSGFHYTSALDGLLLNQGVFNGFSETYNGQLVFHLEGFSVAVADLSSWIATNNPDALRNALFGGDDSLLGGAGDDTLSGWLGNNVLFGGGGNDVIEGSIDGFNRVNGNAGNDTVYGWSDIGDWLLGGQGNDRIDASLSNGHNICNGYKDNDTIFGGSGGDTLRGGMGNDVIIGGIRDDHLYGDRGSNTLTGGQGADTFHNASAVEYSLATITDFNQAQGDHIAIDAGLTWTATQDGANVHVVVSNGAEFILQQTQLSSLTTGWIGN